MRSLYSYLHTQTIKWLQSCLFTHYSVYNDSYETKYLYYLQQIEAKERSKTEMKAYGKYVHHLFALASSQKKCEIVV
jgi:hypothetical protein